MATYEPAKDATDALAKLSRILLALAVQNGGELRIQASEVDSLDTRRVLMRDYDPKTGDIVIRAGTPFAEFLQVQPEAAQWTKRIEDRQEQTGQTPPRTSSPTDAHLAEIEAGLRRRAENRRQARQATEAGEAYQRS